MSLDQKEHEQRNAGESEMKVSITCYASSDSRVRDADRPMRTSFVFPRVETNEHVENNSAVDCLSPFKNRSNDIVVLIYCYCYSILIE